MMGQQPPDQNALSYEFCLENYDPQDHLLRQIDPLLDLSDLRKNLTAYYSYCCRNGRPSVDPEVLISMRIVGYCYGIRRPPPSPRQPAAGQTITYPRTGTDQPKHPRAV